MRPQRKQIGMAIVGCGTIGRIAAIIATDENAHVGGLIQLVRVSGPAAAALVSARGARPHARGSAKSRLKGVDEAIETFRRDTWVIARYGPR
jgi:hypothetical protein